MSTDWGHKYEPARERIFDVLGPFAASPNNAESVARRLWPLCRVVFEEAGSEAAHRLDLQAINHEQRAWAV